MGNTGKECPLILWFRKFWARILQLCYQFLIFAFCFVLFSLIIYEQKQMFSTTNIWSVYEELRALYVVKAMNDT